MRSRKDQQRISAQETTWIKELNSDISFLCDSWNKLPASLKLCKQSILGPHTAEHGITKREAIPPFPSKFYMSQIIECYLQTGKIKRKVNLQLKLGPNRNTCKVHDFEKFGQQKYLIIRIQNYCNLVWKNWADIESRSKNNVKGTIPADEVYWSCAYQNKGDSTLLSQYRPNSWS